MTVDLDWENLGFAYFDIFHIIKTVSGMTDN